MKLRTLNPNAGAPARSTQTDRLAVPLPLPSFSNKSQEDGQTVARTATASPEIPQEGNDTSSQSSRSLLISVDLIDPHPTPPRTVYTDETLLERAESLRSEGQLNPIHVMPNPASSGRFIIIDGWTRVLACQKHKALPELRAEVHHDLSLEDAAWFGWQSNEGRQQHCDYDRAMFFEKFFAQGMTAAEISRRAGIKTGTMTMYRAYSRLPGEVIDVITENPLKYGHRAAYELFRIFDETKNVRKTLAIALKFAAEDHTVRWLINEAQAIITPNKTKAATPNKKVIRFTNGTYKQMADDFFLSIKVSPEKREFFGAALEKLLNEVAIQSPPRDPGSPGEADPSDQSSTTQ